MHIMHALILAKNRDENGKCTSIFRQNCGRENQQNKENSKLAKSRKKKGYMYLVVNLASPFDHVGWNQF